MSRRLMRNDDKDKTDNDRALDGERSASRQRMFSSYEQMMNTYAKQQQELSGKPAWSNVKTKGSIEPSDYTVTHVNQTKDLARAENKVAGVAESQSSSEWLSQHSIAEMNLTLKDLVDKGKVGRPGVSRDNGKVQQHIQFEASDINEFEYRLNLAIETFTNRIKWLLTGSRRVFGLVKGNNTAVLIDASDANCGFGRLASFTENLTHLLDEQLSGKKGLYLASFGTDICPLWTHPMNVSARSGEKLINEAKSWIDQMMPSGGSNVLKALKHVFKIKNIDTILLIQGSVPDQKGDAMCSYIEELAVGRDITIQAVAYDCNNQITDSTLKRLAEECGGRFHCYSSTSEEQMYTGSDINTLLQEIQTAQNVINKIKDMRQGLLGTALVSVMNEISSEVAKLPQSRFLPRPPGHEQPLRIEMPKFLAASSAEWLGKHGLKAKGLDLYQVLAPNAYSYKEEFIPVIRKTVSSQVHEKAMTQFEWYDGSLKNVHVDMSQLFEYQKQLGAMVNLYEKRVDWLSSASRKIFGTITEKSAVILVDLSLPNLNYLVHIQHSLRLLMEQQLANKDYFNLIGFGSEAKPWRKTMVRPSPELLQNAWKFILDSQCEGSRNFMDAFRLAVENDEEQKHGVEVEGIYLFTSGIPDQSQSHMCQYIEEACAGRNTKLHVVLFNVDDYDSQGAIPSRYANITKTAECLRNMAHCSGGRFHWFRETGIIESDDIAAINLEIDRSLNFSKKCAYLVESVKQKYDLDYQRKEFLALPSSGQPMKALPPPPPAHRPKPSHNGHIPEEVPAPKAIGWRPSSGKRPDKNPTPESVIKRPQSAKDPMQRMKSTKKVQKQFFFTDDGKVHVGSVFQKYPAQRPRSGRSKPIKAASIPDKEEQISTKMWLRMYSLSKLKLDLNKILSSPECKISPKPIKILNKNVESKVFSMFPTVNVAGTLRHLNLRPQELAEYEDQVTRVLKRYITRLQWLLTGSRRVFGTVAEKKCVFLIDTSGSMTEYMEELRRELASLIWDQLYKHKVSFNLIQFSGRCHKWRESLSEATEEACHDAVQWVSSLTANGNTCTLEALQMAFEDADVESVYLFTDGKPDTSTALVLKEIATINTDRDVSVHTISFNCEDSTANTFLKRLATENKGRYHRCLSESDFDAHMFAHKLLTEGFHDVECPHLPDFEGEDLKRIGAEIQLARKYISQSQTYRLAVESSSTNRLSDKPTENGVLVGPGRSRPMSAKV